MDVVDDVADLSYRKYAKFAGICDAIFSFVSFIVYILLALMVTVFSGTIKALDKMAKPESKISKKEPDASEDSDISSSLPKDDSKMLENGKNFVAYIWASCIADSVITLVQFSLAIMLMNSASFGRTPKNAVNRVLLFVVYNAGVLLAYFIWRIVDRNWATLVICGLFRLIILIIAGMYLRQLNEITTKGNHQRASKIGNENGSRVDENPFRATSSN